jgi:hypothetical protein
MRGNITGCRLYLWAHRAGIPVGVCFKQFNLGAFIMKVSLVALIAACAIASPSLAVFDNPPITPPRVALLDNPPITPPRVALLDNPPITPPRVALLDNPPITPPRAA